MKVLVFILGSLSVNALACPDFSGNYSCNGTPPSYHGKYTQTIYQTPDSVTFGDGAVKLKLGGDTTVDNQAGHIIVTTTCTPSQLIEKYNLNGKSFPGQTVVTKTASGFSTVEADGSTTDCKKN
jgi:microcystin degradation protein MlrC